MIIFNSPTFLNNNPLASWDWLARNILVMSENSAINFVGKQIHKQQKEGRRFLYVAESIRMKYIILLLIGVLFTKTAAYSQRTIQMEYDNGVYRIPCTVNGANMKMVFDTGASTVCLSLATALFLYQNGYITHTDIKGTGQSSTASGDIVNNMNINIRDIEIGGMHLYNVEGVVLESLNAPLLLGQTAIKKLGAITIKDNLLIIGNNYSGNTNTPSYERVQYFKYNGYRLDSKVLIQRMQMSFTNWANSYNLSSKYRDRIADVLHEFMDLIRNGEYEYNMNSIGLPVDYLNTKSKKDMKYMRNAVAYVAYVANQMVQNGEYVK